MKKFYSKSIFYKFISSLDPVFFLTLIYYCSLFFSTSNRTLLLLTSIYLALLYLKLKNFQQSILICFVATLPFAKGKSIAWQLLPKQLIAKNALFDLKYFFNIYLSSIFLFLLVYWYIKKRFFKKNNRLYFDKSILFLFLFIYSSLIPAIFSHYPEVIILSALQLLLLAIIYCLPLFFENTKKILNNLALVMAAFTIFESFWVILQRIRSGPLGLDLEVYLPGAENGIVSLENREIFRSAGTFFEPSILGTFLLMQLFFFLTLLVFNKEKKLRFIYSLTALLTIIGLIGTASRGVYFLSVIFFGVFFIVFRKKILVSIDFKKMLLRIVPILVIILIFSYSFLSERLETIGSFFSSEGSGTYRIQLITYAIRLGYKSLFGVGLNLSPYFLATSFPLENYIFDPTPPHNIFFLLFAETGFPGLIIFILFLYFALKSFFSIKNIKNMQFLVAALVFILCAQIYPLFITHPEILSFFFLYLGIAHFSNAKK